jgi:hypothetical protein
LESLLIAVDDVPERFPGREKSLVRSGARSHPLPPVDDRVRIGSVVTFAFDAWSRLTPGRNVFRVSAGPPGVSGRSGLYVLGPGASSAQFAWQSHKAAGELATHLSYKC